MFGVLAVLLGPSQILPGLLSLGVALERSHSVQVGFDGTTFRLVLKHEATQGNDSSIHPTVVTSKTHQHGFASRVLCFLGDAASSHPDHSASFTTDVAWSETEAPVTLNPSLAERLDLPVPVVGGGEEKTLSQKPHLVLDHGPPGDPGWRALLRSTVFLI